MSKRFNKDQFNINFDKYSLENKLEKVTKGEFLAGGGGFTYGAKQVEEIETKWIFNHDRIALKTNAFHNKNVKVFWADLYVQDEHELEYVDYIHASIECDQHSNANAGKAKNIGSYMMGLELIRYIKFLNPLVLSIENVKEFKKWAPVDEDNNPIKELEGQEFEKWKNTIMALGYEYIESIRNAADDGLPTRRERFFCFFYKPGIEITFPETTHDEKGNNGKIKWLSCREHIDTEDLGISVFGREFNNDLPKHLRRKLCNNSMRRIAGGIKKQYPEFYQFLCKYHAGDNPERSQSLNKPINVIDTSNRHQLVTVENGQFIQDHCHTDNYQDIETPLRPQLTWQTKELITLEKLKFIMDHCHSDKVQSLDEPLQPQTTRQSKQFVYVEADDSFIVQYYGGSIQSNTLDEPINVIPCRDIHQLLRVEKMQFIAKYFNSSDNPEGQTQSLNSPLSAVLGTNKHQLITLLDNFDIKARFLRADELAACSTFPRNYFSHPELKLSQKVSIQLIGNAVPPLWATKLLKQNVNSILDYKKLKLSA